MKRGDVAFYFAGWLTQLAGLRATPLRGAETFVQRFKPAVFTAMV